MSKVKITLNKNNIKALLQSQMMMDATQEAARRKGEIDTYYVGFDRVQVVVKKEDTND